MKLELITLTGVALKTAAYQVNIPTADGEIGVFPDHEPLVTVAVPGVIAVRYRKDDLDDQVEFFAISGGVVKVDNEKVSILVDEAEHGEAIDEAETRAALERAREMRDQATDQVELDKAHQLIDRHLVRLKVADIRRRKNR